MKNFVEQIPIKFGGFCVIKMNLVQTVQWQVIKISMKISADIQKV